MKSYKEFIYENKEEIFSGEFVANYIIDISGESGVPDYTIEKDILTNDFKLTKLNIIDLVNSDVYFKEYFDSKEDRYDEYNEEEYPHSDNLYNPVVVVDNIVSDGYNRMTMLYQLGEKIVDAYVNI